MLLVLCRFVFIMVALCVADERYRWFRWAAMGSGRERVRVLQNGRVRAGCVPIRFASRGFAIVVDGAVGAGFGGRFRSVVVNRGGSAATKVGQTGFLQPENAQAVRDGGLRFRRDGRLQVALRCAGTGQGCGDGLVRWG